MTTWATDITITAVFDEFIEATRQTILAFQRFTKANIDYLVFQMNGWQRFRFRFITNHWQPFKDYIQTALQELKTILRNG